MTSRICFKYLFPIASLILTFCQGIVSSMAQTCVGSLGDPVVNVTFGTGTGFTSLPTAASGASTTYNLQNQQCPNDGNYAVTNTTSGCFGNAWFTASEDRTPNDVNGRMAVFNASYTVGEFYRQTVSGLCGNTTYEFAAWIANLLRPTACSSNGIDPNLTFKIESLSGVPLGTYTTGNITEAAAVNWRQYGFTFTTPPSQTQVILKIINNAPGGCGNDILLDDITFRPCGPTISVNANVPSICEGSSVNLSGSISPGYNNPQFQWQQSSDNGLTWSDISGATSLNVTVASAPAGTRYRLLAAEQGNIGIGYCRIASNPVALTVHPFPKVTLPTSNGGRLDFCAGKTIDLADFTASPPATFNWTLDNTAIGLNQSSGTGQIPTFTAINNTGTPAISGKFTVTASANGCTSKSQSFNVHVCEAPVVSTSPDQTICIGSSVTISASATKGSPSYSFSWDNGLGAGATKTVSPTSTTIYTVTVTDSKGCQHTDPIKITVNPAPVINALTKTDVAIFGQATGSITVAANGATPLKYSIDGVNFQNSNVFAGLRADTYTITVQDANGCRVQRTVVVNEPGELKIEATVGAATCYGGTDGKVVVKVTGGIAPYSYEWSDGTTGTPELIGRPAGTYTVKVTDAKGATRTATVTIAEPSKITIVGNLTHVTCNGGTNGKIETKATSIVAIKSYEWRNTANTVISNTANATNLGAGKYTLMVTDNNDCKDSASFVIQQPSAIVATPTAISPTCFAGTNGSVSVAASGGTSTLQYALCSGMNCTNFGTNQTSNVFNNLSVGTYRVRVTDANGCSTITNNSTIAQTPQLVASASNTSPVCEGGTLGLSAANAGANVSYEWRGPSGLIISTSQQFSLNNVTIAHNGTYTLTVRNTDGCTNSTTTTVTIRPKPLADAGTDQTICEGTTVTLAASATNGTPSYSYSWNNGLGVGMSKSVSPATNTEYIVTVTDANGCIDADTVRVNVIAKPQIFTLTAPSDLTICAGVNGIPLTLSGSQVGVLYEMIKNNTNFGNGKQGTGSTLALGNYFGGTYQVKATTLTNPACAVIMTGSITVNELSPLTTTLQYADDTLCVGESMQFTAAASGGSGTGYTYTWQDGQTGSSRVFTTNSYLLVELTVTDSRGCMVKQAMDLRAVPALNLDITASPTTICAGTPVALSATANGALGNFIYEWENGSSNPVRTVSPNTTTTYNVKVTDTKEGCTAQKSVVVTVNPQPQPFSLTGGGAYCAGGNGVAVALSGSQINFNYQLKRDGQNIDSPVVGTGAALSFGNQSVAGTYTVEATSTTSPACTTTMTGSVLVSVNTKPDITANAAPTTVCAGQSVNLSASPIIANATYAWTGPNGFTSTLQNPNITSATTANGGTYTVIVTTAQGCRDTATVALAVNPRPSASISGPVNLCVNNPISLNGNPSGGTGPYTHNWQITAGNSFLTLTNNNNGTATLNPTTTGVATLTYQVTDSRGCQSPVVNYSVGINAALPTASVSAGTPVGFTSVIGARYRAFNRPSDKELFLGIPDLGGAPPRRSQADITWRATNDVSFEYDPATDQLRATIINSAGTFNLTYTNVLAQANTYRPGPNVCAMNVMQISVGSQIEPTATVAFNNVTLNGDPLGNFSGAGFNNWTVRNVDFGLGFKMTGTIVLTGTQPTAAETNRVDVLVGNDQTPTVFGCMSVNEVCEGQASTVSFSGLRPNTTFNLRYSIGNSRFTTSVTTDTEGNASFQTTPLLLAQNGTILKIDSVQRAVTGACLLPITANNAVSLIVNAKPTGSITIAENSGNTPNDAVVCANDAITLTTTASGTYSWNTGATSASITVSPATNTTYSVKVTSNKGCETTLTQSVTVNPKPTPTATNNGALCVGEALTLSASGGVGYEWRNSANVVVASQSVFNKTNVALTDAGTYTVKVTDINGCSATTQTTLVVKENPLAQASSNAPRCANQTLTLHAAGAGVGAIYAWTGPNGFSRTNEQNPLIINTKPIDSGVYTLVVTRNNCSTTDTILVTVYETPIAQIASNSPVCENAPLNLTAQNAGTGASYEWLKNNSVIGTNAQLSLSKTQLSDAGKYVLKVTKNGCTATDTVEVLVKPLPKVTVNKVLPLCARQTLPLTSITSPGATRYDWSGPNGFISPEQNPKIENITTDATGTYEVIASLEGCRDTARVQVIVNPTPIAIATASPAVCEGKNITLTAVNAGTGAQYEWKNPNGTIVSTASQFSLLNALSSNSGIYRLKVTLGLCLNEDTASVTIHPLPKITLVSALCEPNLKTYSVRVTIEGSTVTASTGTVQQLAPNLYVVSGIASSVKSIQVTVSSDKGCDSTITVQAPNCSCPAVNVPVSGGDKSYCEDQPIPTLTATVANNETIDWYDTATGGTPIAIGTNSFVPQAAGTYYAQTRNLIHECTSNTRTAIKLTVHTLPNLTIDSTVCGVDLSNFVIWLKTEPNSVIVQASEGTVVDFTNGRYEIIAINPAGNPTVTVTVTHILTGCKREVIVKKPNCLCPDLEAPRSAGDQDVCEKQPNPVLSVTVKPNETTDWYDAPVGGNKIATDTTKFVPTATLVGTYTYYAETRRTDITVRTCVSNVRTPIKLTIKALPTVLATSNAPICENEDLQLATSPQADATYAWTGPNSFASTERSPIRTKATPNISGKYVVTITAKGCIQKDSVEVLVKSLPTVNTSGVVICESSSFTLQTDSIANATYEWRNPTNQLIGNYSKITSQSSLLENAGVYSVKVTLNNCSTTDTANVTVKPLPLAQGFSNSPVCSGDTLRFNAANAGTGAIYQWQSPTGTVVAQTPNFQRPTATAQDNGQWVLTVTQNGCIKTDTITVMVKALPTFTIASNSPICYDDTLKLYVQNPPQGAIFEWSGANQFLSFQQNPVIAHARPNMSGLYTVTVTANNCVKTDTITVAVAPKTVANILSNAPICQDDTLRLTAQNAGIGAVYQWFRNNTVVGNEPVLQVVNVPLTSAGRYVLKVTLNDCVSYDTIEVAVKARPIFALNSNTPRCVGDALRLWASGAPLGSTFSWSGPEAITDTDSMVVLPNVAISASGLYKVIVRLDGCEAEDTLRVRIKPLPSINLSSNAPVCAGQTLQLSTNAIANTTYEWRNRNGQIVGNNASLSVVTSLASPPTSRFSLLATLDGCSRTDTIEVQVKSRPAFKIDSVVCSPSLKTYTIYGKTQATVTALQGDVSQSDSLFTLSLVTIGTEAQLKFTQNGCDTTFKVSSPNCLCPSNIPIVEPENQTICEGIPIQVLTAKTTTGFTADWYDAPTGGNKLAEGTLTFQPSKAGSYYVQTRALVSGCVSSVRAVSSLVIHPVPSFGISTIMASCDGLNVRKDAQLLIANVQNGSRFDYVVGNTYTGTANYSSARQLPNTGVLADTLSNPSQDRLYTVRVFEATGCYSDRTVALLPGICECPRPPFVVPESQSICEGDTLRTIRGFVDAGITVDWYDELGNLLKKGSIFFKPNQAGTYYAEARDTLSGCKSTFRTPSFANINPHPSFQLVLTRGTCDGVTVRSDAKISLLELKNGSRYDYNKGQSYTGSKTYTTATEVPTDGIILNNLANPSTTEYYTVRVFDNTNCFADSTIVFEPRICECPKPPFVVPESQTICDGDTLRTVRGFVDSGITVDWYDAPTGGNLLKRGSIFFKPAQAGTYYAEARDTTTNCKGIVRVPSYAYVNDLPTYDLEVIKPTCSQNQAQNDGKIKIKRLQNGSRYDVSVGSSYSGGKTFATATHIAADSILLNQVPNPASSQTYTVRVFGEPNCFADKTVNVTNTVCGCTQTPSFQLVLTRGTCDGVTVRSDAKISLLELKNGSRYDYNKGQSYTGSKTYTTATEVPTDGIILNNLANPSTTEYYTVRVFDATNCFTDSTIVFEPRICECPKPPFVVPESQTICDGDTLRTVRGFVDSGITVDWYDAPTGGNLLKRGSIFFKPAQAGTYYAEARDTTTNCKGIVRVPSYAYVNDLPTYDLEVIKPTCSQNQAQNDGKIKIKRLQNGSRYDVSVGSSYSGGKTFATATHIAADSILLNQVPNPASSQTYTVRVFGEPNCFADKTVNVSRFDCNCTPIDVTVVPTSFRICEGEPFPVIQGFVGQGVTIDWYDQNGNLLKQGSLTYQPTTFGEFYAEGRSLVQSGCISSSRAKAVGSAISKPTFTLSSRPATCIGTTAKNDAQIIIENSKDGDKYDFTVGDTYTGTATYSTAQTTPINGLITNNLPNITQSYTVRVFNRCGLYEDKKIRLQANNCQCTPPNCFPLGVKRKKKK